MGTCWRPEALTYRRFACGRSPTETNLSGHKNWVGSLIFSRTGKELISGSVDNTVRLWDMATGNEIRQLDTPRETVECLSLSPDGTTVAIGYFQSKAIRLRDSATGKVIRTFD